MQKQGNFPSKSPVPFRPQDNRAAQTFNLGVGQVRVHLDGVKHFGDLLEPPCESVKLSKNIHLGELKLFLIWYFLQLLLGLVKASLRKEIVIKDKDCTSC